MTISHLMTIAAWNIDNMPEEQRAEQALEFLMSMPELKDKFDLWICAGDAKDD